MDLADIAQKPKRGVAVESHLCAQNAQRWGTRLYSLPAFRAFQEQLGAQILKDIVGKR